MTYQNSSSMKKEKYEDAVKVLKKAIELDDEDIPENVKIYGVLQGRIVYRDLNDGRIGCCRFDQMFEEGIAEDEDADSFVEDGSVVPAEDDSGAGLEDCTKRTGD